MNAGIYFLEWIQAEQGISNVISGAGITNCDDIVVGAF